MCALIGQSTSEITSFKQNAIPKRTKHATKFGSIIYLHCKIEVKFVLSENIILAFISQV